MASAGALAAPQLARRPYHLVSPECNLSVSLGRHVGRAERRAARISADKVALKDVALKDETLKDEALLKVAQQLCSNALPQVQLRAYT